MLQWRNGLTCRILQMTMGWKLTKNQKWRPLHLHVVLRATYSLQCDILHTESEETGPSHGGTDGSTGASEGSVLVPQQYPPAPAQHLPRLDVRAGPVDWPPCPARSCPVHLHNDCVSCLRLSHWQVNVASGTRRLHSWPPILLSVFK